MARVPYEKLPGFEYIYLEDSFLLACIESESAIVFSLDLVLTPGHESYGPAKPDEQHCYRYGKLVFKYPSVVTWLHRHFDDPSVDANGEIDFGAIDTMVLENGVYRLIGSWGDVTIKSDPPAVVLTQP